MKTNNAFVDALIDSQSQALNHWLDASQKMQSAIASGNLTSEGPSIYKEWLEKQTALMGGTTSKLNDSFSTPQNQIQDFFKNWFQSQADYTKRMSDFNQSLYNTYANFGKPANDYINNFNSMNTQWNSIYNEWVKATTNTIDTYQGAFKNAFNKNLYQELIQSNIFFNSFKDIYNPILESFKKGEYNPESFKQLYATETYKKLTDQIFGGLFNTTPDLKNFFDGSLGQIHNYFTTNNSLREQYTAYFKKLVDSYPQLFNGNFEDIKQVYAKFGDIYSENFKPLTNLINNQKDKEAITESFELMDKIAQYAIKQAEISSEVNLKVFQSVEKIAEKYAGKVKDLSEKPSLDNINYKDVYNEWLKEADTLLTELFATEYFSKLKSDILNLSMDIKTFFEKQFEQALVLYPIAKTSEIEELYKIIHDLKKQVKNMEQKIELIIEEDKKSRKSTAK